MGKKMCYVYIAVFFAVLLIPLLAYPLLRTRLDLTNYENRELSTIKDVVDSKWSDFFPNFEVYFKDHIPYKNESVDIINKIDEVIFHDMFNRSVIVGKDGWLFYKGENCIQDYRGGYILSEQELKEYTAAANKLNMVMGKMGIKLYIMITPNKETIYGDKFLPDKVVKYSNYSRADQIVGYLHENTNISIVYPKKELTDAASVAQVWRKYDTHWNELGAFVASQSLLSALGYESRDLGNVEYTKNGKCSGDLANMLGMVTKYSDDDIYKIIGYNQQVNFEVTEWVEQSNLSYARVESDIENEAKILLIGDSFLGLMEGYLASNFEISMFVHRDNYGLLDKDLIREEQPDIVVFQTAERFLNALDEYMDMYAAWYETQDNE